MGERDALTERDWVAAIARVHGWDGAGIVEHPRDGVEEDYDQPLVLDTSRIRAELGWEPRTSLDAAIRAPSVRCR